MFDNPKNDLHRIQRDLMDPEEGPLEEAYFADADSALEEMKELLQQEDWEESEREPLFRRYSGKHGEDRPEEGKREQKHKEGRGGLIFSIVVELLGILGLAWWLLWS